MLEVEVKYRPPARDVLMARLVTLGATLAETRVDEDHYLAAPDRDLKATDEAFRIRRTGDHTRLTYKGPKREAETKTRLEIEVPLADGPGPAADAAALFGHLGYRPVAVVRKRRAVYTFPHDGFAVEACLDDVDGVGFFAELEIQAADAEFERAKAALLAAAAALGLTAVERRSYLSMLLASG